MTIIDVLCLILISIMGVGVLTVLLTIVFAVALEGVVPSGQEYLAFLPTIIISMGLIVCADLGYAKQLTSSSNAETTKQLAKSYQITNPDEKPIELNLKGEDAPLPNVPDEDNVTEVFYTNSNGKAVSGGQDDYRQALKSDNLVYVFTTK